MKKIIEKMNLSFLKAQMATRRFLTEERGDTNFLSIAIILVVVIVIAIVFIGFGDSLKAKLSASITNLLNVLP